METVEQTPRKPALDVGAINRAHADELFSKPRKYRARLVVFVFADIELEAAHPNLVYQMAEQRAAEARRDYRTEPVSFRQEIQRRKDPRDPDSELEWVEIDYLPSDPFNADSPRCWQIVR